MQHAKCEFVIGSKKIILEAQMGKHLPKTKRSPCEITYQKFHPRIHVLEILLFPSTHWIGSRVSTMTASAHS
jgi:hypothetical protein